MDIYPPESPENSPPARSETKSKARGQKPYVSTRLMRDPAFSARVPCVSSVKEWPLAATEP